MIAFSRPFWPLFLHVLGAMTLFGAVLAAVLTAAVAGRYPEMLVLRRVTWRALLVAVPAYVVMRGAAQWIYSDEGWSGHGDPTWLGIGFAVSDIGLLVLLGSLGAAYWWHRSGRSSAGRITAALCTVLVLMLAVAWLAMSGKWS